MQPRQSDAVDQFVAREANAAAIKPRVLETQSFYTNESQRGIESPRHYLGADARQEVMPGRLDSSLRFIDIKTLCLEKPSAL